MTIKEKLKMDSETKLYLLLGLYVGSLYAANLLGGKLMPIGFGDRGLSVSIITFPFMFLITDIVGEVYGKKKAKKFVRVGLVSLMILLLWQIFSVGIPAAAPNPWYKEIFNPAYPIIFNLSISFTIASILAFFFGQYVDVFTFNLIKKKQKGKNMWIRNNVSTILGQFIDTNIWVFIAFLPNMLAGTMQATILFTSIILPYWLAKVIFAFIDTPLCYVGVWWLRGSKKEA
ncbi:MAG: queuosine precursor transporter [Thermoplasmatota archaeon]